MLLALVHKMHWHRPCRKKVVSSQSQKSGKAISPFLSDRVTNVLDDRSRKQNEGACACVHVCVYVCVYVCMYLYTCCKFKEPNAQLLPIGAGVVGNLRSATSHHETWTVLLWVTSPVPGGLVCTRLK